VEKLRLDDTGSWRGAADDGNAATERSVTALVTSMCQCQASMTHLRARGRAGCGEVLTQFQYLPSRCSSLALLLENMALNILSFVVVVVVRV
jgi:hypothetical protein